MYSIYATKLEFNSLIKETKKIRNICNILHNVKKSLFILFYFFHFWSFGNFVLGESCIHKYVFLSFL